MKYKKTRSNLSIFIRILFLILIFGSILYGVGFLLNRKDPDKISDGTSKTKVIDLEHAVVDAEKNKKGNEPTDAKGENKKIEEAKSEEVKMEGEKAHTVENPNTSSQGAKPKVKQEPKQEVQTQSDNPSQEEHREFTLSPRFNQEIADRFSYVKNEPNSIHVMLNKKNALPEGFKTQNLVVPDIKFPFTHETPKKYMRKEAAEALTKLCAAAEADGHTIYGISGYRSYETQKNLYNMYVNRDGQESADKYSSKPGHSEHQSGLVMDVSSKDGKFDLLESFGDLPEGKWIAENSHKYGFVVRYLKDKVDITGYAYEPWHLRYVGEEVATYMYENNLCFEEFYDIIGVLYNR